MKRPISRQTSDALILPLLVGALAYSIGAGEWWLFAAAAGVGTVFSLREPMERHYREATAVVSKVTLTVLHAFAVGLLVVLAWTAPAMTDAHVVEWVVFAGLAAVAVAYLGRGVVAWRRYRGSHPSAAHTADREA